MSRSTESALPKRLPNVGNNRPTLTRTEQVLKAIRKGARIEATGERGLLRLLDRQGIEIPAWQTALKAAQRQNERDSSALLDAHLDYMSRYTGHHVPLITPCCSFEIDVPAPSDAADCWDSLMRCPNCGRLFMKVATSAEAYGRLPEQEEA